MELDHLPDWPLNRLLIHREAVRDTLAATSEHLYPLYHDYLSAHYRAINVELARRHDDAVVCLDELSLVGDRGSLEDALWRLQRRPQE